MGLEGEVRKMLMAPAKREPTVLARNVGEATNDDLRDPEVLINTVLRLHEGARDAVLLLAREIEELKGSR